MGEMVLKSAADAAAALDHAQAQIRAGEVTTLVAIAALCDDRRVDESVLVEGAERWVPGGADGTPHIAEFVAGEIAGILGVSIGAAIERIAETLNLRHRHATLWQHVMEGSIRAWDAVRVARAAVMAGLDHHACLRLDDLCAAALAFQPWQLVRRQIHRWILLADPAKAAEREAARKAQRYIHLGRIEDGHVGLWGQLNAADGLALDEALDHVALTLDSDSGDQQVRRSVALGIIARHVLGHEPLPAPASPSRRQAEIVVRLDGSALHDPTAGVASLDQWGDVLVPRLRDLLDGCTIKVRPVVSGEQLPATDAYQVPKAMWLAVQARNPVDVFPWGTRVAHACQADHTIPYDHHAPADAGQTNVANLGPLSSFTHRLKTHGGWQLDQPIPGVFLWRSPLGYEYLVTPTGTTMVNRPPPREHEWWHQEPPEEPPEEPPAWAIQDARDYPAA